VSLRRLAVLQWFGILAGGVTWFASFLAGTGVSVATCNPAGRGWGIPYDTVQVALLAFSAAVILGAEGAALTVFRATRSVEEEGAPPHGRLHFFAAAALLANLIFLLVLVLAVTLTVVFRTCQQA
jgi:hypothetical protein